MASYRFAVVGATGLVGKNILSVLAERGVPMSQVVAIASDKSQNNPVSYGEMGVLKTRALSSFDFKDVDLAFFCVTESISKLYIPQAVAKGCKVIDKSSLHRLDPSVPLIVPEVNGERLHTALKKGIVANPNCVVIPLAMVMKPLHDHCKLKRAVVCTYQSVSGSGQGAMEELHHQSRAYVVNDPVEIQHFSKQIAFNVIPIIDYLSASGFTGEEEKIASEIKKIVDPSIKVSATCVRVPVFIGHSMAVHLEFKESISVSEARDMLSRMPGLMVIDHPQDNGFVTPLDVVSEDLVFVSRIRKDPTVEHGLALWISCDNLRKGAALNGVQIAEKLMEYKHT